MISKIEKEHGDIYSSYVSIMCNIDGTKIISIEDLNQQIMSESKFNAVKPIAMNLKHSDEFEVYRDSGIVKTGIIKDTFLYTF